MQLGILIIGALFPSIPLMIVNFGNHYSVLAILIRHLHDEVIRNNDSQKNAERFLLQIDPLPNSLRLFSIIHSCAAISFVLALSAMIAICLYNGLVSNNFFIGWMLLVMGSILLFTREIQIANTGLDLHLSELETHHEWEPYLKPKLYHRTAKENRGQATERTGSAF